MSYLSLLIIIVFVISCSSEQETKQAEPEIAEITVNTTQDTEVWVDTAKTFDYSTWNSIHFENVKILYDKGHPFSDKMQDYAQVYKTILRRNSQFFYLPEPTDSIVIFYYTGFGQGQDLGNSEFPTARGDSIYYWTGNKMGITAAMHALKRWTKIETKHRFLYQGIMRLLDASGRDYHSMTLAFIDSSKFKTINDLLVDERMNFHADAYQTAEAASFVDYFVYKFGIDNFKLLYESQLEFDPTVQAICKMNIDALEKDWIALLRRAAKKQ